MSLSFQLYSSFLLFFYITDHVLQISTLILYSISVYNSATEAEISFTIIPKIIAAGLYLSDQARCQQIRGQSSSAQLVYQILKSISFQPLFLYSKSVCSGSIKSDFQNVLQSILGGRQLDIFWRILPNAFIQIYLLTLLDNEIWYLGLISFFVSGLNGILGLISHNKRHIATWTFDLTITQIFKEKIFTKNFFYYFCEFFSRPLLLSMTVIVSQNQNFIFPSSASNQTPLTTVIVWFVKKKQIIFSQITCFFEFSTQKKDFLLIFTIMMILFLYYTCQSQMIGFAIKSAFILGFNCFFLVVYRDPAKEREILEIGVSQKERLKINFGQTLLLLPIFWRMVQILGIYTVFFIFNEQNHWNNSGKLALSLKIISFILNSIYLIALVFKYLQIRQLFGDIDDEAINDQKQTDSNQDALNNSRRGSLQRSLSDINLPTFSINQTQNQPQNSEYTPNQYLDYILNNYCPERPGVSLIEFSNIAKLEVLPQAQMDSVTPQKMNGQIGD